MSRLRANQITNENANGSPNFPHGLTVTGIVTASTINSTTTQIVAGAAVTANSGGVDTIGIVTASSYRGDGSQLTGIDALKNGSDVKVQANASGAVVTGIITATERISGVTTTASQVLEVIAGPCDGVARSSSFGSVAIENVTGSQDGTTSYVDVTGSTITYRPPIGTHTVIYEFQFHGQGADSTGIGHFKFFIDGTEVTYQRWTQRSGGVNAECNFHYRAVIPIGGSADTNTGRLANWNTAKTLKIQFREYSGSYEYRLHKTNEWDGSGTDVFVQPSISVTAIGTPP
mgnify:CR=1 FL=1